MIESQNDAPPLLPHNPAQWNWNPAWFDRFRWSTGPDEPLAETAQGKIAIVGLAGGGKKTLLNAIWGWQAVAESSEMTRNFGVFTLINLPVNPYDTASVMYRLENVELILYVLDASLKLQSEDFAWITRLRALDTAMVVVANKADLLEKSALEKTVAMLRERTARPVLPAVAQNGDTIHTRFIPALLQVCPNLAVPLGAEIAWLRHKVARHLVLRSVVASATLSVETNPSSDITSLLDLQLRLVKRIASLYGQKERGLRHREMLVSTALRVYLQAVVRLAARLPQVRAWVMSGSVGGFSTFCVGWLAIQYFGGKLPNRIGSAFAIQGESPNESVHG